MRTLLDARMDGAMAALTAPGGQLALGTVERGGIVLPVIATAPPTLPEYMARSCADHAARTFLVDGAQRLTFGAAHDHALAFAHALAGGHGVMPGDRIGIAARNSAAWVVLYMAVLMAGGVATLLNAWWNGDELAAAVEDVGCRLVLADPPRAARLAGRNVRVLAFDDEAPLDEALRGLLAVPAADALPVVGPDDPATILFTSGSTGRSRGALSDHRAVVQAAFNFYAQALMMRRLAIEDGTVLPPQPCTLLNLPLFHVTAEVPVLLQSFALGRKLVVMRRWDAGEAMRLIAAERATYFVGAPLMSFEMATHPDRARHDLSSVADFSAGGAPRPVAHVRRIAQALPGAPLIGYGLTESNAAGAANWRSNYLARPGSTGRAAAPLIDLAILDDAGARLPPGTRGEIAIRSICTFAGYWNDAEASAAAMTADGWLRTGDIGHLDADGYLTIVDRLKDIIIRGGENIACQEVEAALYAHPAVAEAAVFALADARLGEVPGAVVRLRAASDVDAAALADFLAARIARFKLPRHIWITEAPLPRLGSQKIDKARLRADYAEQAVADAA